MPRRGGRSAGPETTASGLSSSTRGRYRCVPRRGAPRKYIGGADWHQRRCTTRARGRRPL
uniref:Uncharacterized protein n=1 Tax=Human herpesvirus 2 TaxID=10310 RepID=A0A481TBE0_HHV2|nr:hypothetical protein [Human alphaherpesvirus 2]